MTRDELDAARQETVMGISGCLQRLEAARTLLSLEQRFALAEECRNLADALDKGRVLRSTSKPMPPKRLVRTGKLDSAGRPLFRVE